MPFALHYHHCLLVALSEYTDCEIALISAIRSRLRSSQDAIYLSREDNGINSGERNSEFLNQSAKGGNDWLESSVKESVLTGDLV